MTITKQEYAALSAHVYNNQRSGGEDSIINHLGVPPGWQDLERLGFTTGDYLNKNPFSFTAGAYINAVGEIVIAYKGTDFLTELEGRSWNTAADLIADAGLATAIRNFNVGQQLYASSYFLAAKQWAVDHGYSTANITFTGHSLGGGLASNMSVWFNRPATTFAEGPFEVGTLDPVAVVAAAATLTLQAGVSASQAILEEILTLKGAYANFSAREAGVTNYYIKGELLGYLRSVIPTVVGAGRDNSIDIGDQPIGRALALHSINLHLAVLMDDRLRAACISIPELVPTLLDKTLYAADPNFSQPDFITRLVADQLRGDMARQNGLLGKFVGDLQKLNGNAGITAQPEVRTGLIAVAMEYYNKKDAASATSIFTVANGGLHFKYSDIDASGNTTYKSLPRLEAAIEGLLSTAEKPFAGRLLNQNAWHIQQGASALVWTAAQGDTQNDAAIGGVGVDILDAGAGNDILIGGANSDVLTGGTGSDILMGGLGFDTYLYKAGDGSDTIIDTDGQGVVKIDNGIGLTGGKKAAAGYWISDDKKYGFALVTNGTGGTDLIISRGSALDQITIRNWQAGQLGIVLSDTPIAPPPTPVNVKNGTAGSDALSAINASSQASVINGFAGNDLLFGGALADVLDGGSENDALSGFDGDDKLDGGLGVDVLMGGYGQDTLNGGAGNDYIFGSGVGEDGHNSGGSPQGVLVASGLRWGVYDQGGNTLYFQGLYPATYANDATNFIDGGAGDDYILTGSGNDVAHGGDNNDLIFGLGSADTLYGDAGDDTVFGDGLHTFDGVFHVDYNLTGADVIDGGAGCDLMYGDQISNHFMQKRTDRLMLKDLFHPAIMAKNDPTYQCRSAQ